MYITMFYYSSSSLAELDSELDPEVLPQHAQAHATAATSPGMLVSPSTFSLHGQASGRPGKSDELNSISRTLSQPFPSSCCLFTTG